MPLERGLKERTPHRRPHVESINKRSVGRKLAVRLMGASSSWNVFEV